jgi:hypothetical protein
MNKSEEARHEIKLLGCYSMFVHWRFLIQQASNGATFYHVNKKSTRDETKA